MRVSLLLLLAFLGGCHLGDRFRGGDDLGTGGDMSGTVDMAGADLPSGACTAPAKRCNPTNHAVAQTCDANGQWQDSTCPANTACTDLKGVCVDTAWAQWSHAAPMPSPRFSTINDTSGPGEDIVKDAWTGLSWQLKHPDSTYMWTQGQGYCDGLVYGSFSDWRIPSPIELSTLVDRRVAPGSVPAVQSPFAANTKAEAYWSSLPYPGGYAYYVNYGGGVLNAFAVNEMHRVRCVR